MKIDRLLQINFAFQAVLGAVLLSFGRQDLWVPIAAGTAAVVAIFLNDVATPMRAIRWTATAIAVVRGLFVGYDWFTAGDGVDHLRISADLLIVLQVVLLYIRKNYRIYWQLAILGLLQVVVATALNAGPTFGALLVVYVALAIAALAKLCILSDASRFSETGAPLVPNELGASADASNQDLTTRMLSFALVRCLTVTGALTIVFTFVWFYSLPRQESLEWRAGGQQVSKTSFNVGISFNEMNQILESSDPVMRVFYCDSETDRPQDVLGTPYLRGAVLTRYISHTDQHKRPPGWTPPVESFRVKLATRTDDAPYLKQIIQLRPRSDRVLFSAFPVERIDSSMDGVFFSHGSAQLLRSQLKIEPASEEFRYDLAVVGYKGRRQLQVIPVDPVELRTTTRTAGGDSTVNSAHSKMIKACREFDSFAYRGIAPLTHEVLADAGVLNQSDFQKATAILNWFTTPGRFEYTLDFSTVQRDPTLDPTVDFLLNHRSGHCEYFAGAMTLMLRSQGIPARVAVGFRPSEYNVLGGYYQVRDSDCHAWVEAFLPPHEIKSHMVPGGDAPHGGWIRLDPTPASRFVQSNENANGVMHKFDQALDYLQFVWRDYVSGLSFQNQKSSVYDPLTGGQDAKSVLGAGNWREFISSVLGPFGLDVWNWQNRNWFSWRGFFTTVFLCFLAAGTMRLASIFWPVALKLQRRGDAKGEQPRGVEFYFDLCELLRKQGVVRDETLTATEFAQAAVLAWPRYEQTQILEPLVWKITNEYRRVRFGSAILTEAEYSDIDDSLRVIAGLSAS